MAIGIDAISRVFPRLISPQAKVSPPVEEATVPEKVEVFSATISPATRRSRVTRLESLFTGPMEVIKRNTGSIELTHVIGGGFREIEAEQVLSDIDMKGTLTEVAKDLWAGKSEMMPSLVREFKEIVGTKFNKTTFALMNLTSLALSYYYSNDQTVLTWALNNKGVENALNTATKSLGLDSQAAFGLMLLGIVDVSFLAAVRQKEKTPYEKEIWQINAAVTGISLVLLGIAGDILSKNPTLVQDIFTK